ncbi:MAG: sulfatase [Pirellulaceae bacterium]|nr:sulfatase [Pirellulaceae bacterium]
MVTRYILGCLLLVNLVNVGAIAAAENEPFNLLVVMTDEHNFRTLGCYRETLSPQQALMWGPAVVETPNIDWLAEQGAICTSFYATTPVCSPSRAALFSGRYPQNTPVVTNNIPLDDKIITYAELLRREGYATGYAGKWHLDGNGKPQWAPKRQFGFEDNRFMFNRGHWKKFEITDEGPRVSARNASGAPSYGVDGADAKSFSTDFLTDRTIDFIQAHHDEPFCYLVSLPDPHGPDTVRAPYDTMYAGQVYSAPASSKKPTKGLPSWGQKTQGGFNMAKYYGMVRCIDDNVGKILQCLRDNKLIERTIIVFTSDHGDLRGEHFRHNKGVPYEGSCRIPFLVYYPGKVKPGTRIDQALGSVDFLPTMMSMMGVTTVGSEEGRNASRLFTGGPVDDWRDIAFLRGTGGEQGWLMAVTNRYKFVLSPSDPPWLFDLDRDPDEITNFFDHPGYREIVQQLATQLRAYGVEHGDPFIQVARIKADLEWSIRGTGPYVGQPSKPARPAARKRKKSAKKKSKE